MLTRPVQDAVQHRDYQRVYSCIMTAPGFTKKDEEENNLKNLWLVSNFYREDIISAPEAAHRQQTYSKLTYLRVFCIEKPSAFELEVSLFPPLKQMTER